MKRIHRHIAALKAFSLVEVMVGLIVIAIVAAAFAPVISKKIAKMVVESSQKEDVAYYVGAPRSQADCDYVSKALLFVELPTGNLCVSRYNIGDHVNGLGYEAPATAGVTTVAAGKTCGSDTDYDTKCCWQGKTALDCNSAGGKYSGCNRTVCNWQAANSICSSLGMRLATVDELKTIQADFSVDKKMQALKCVTVLTGIILPVVTAGLVFVSAQLITIVTRMVFGLTNIAEQMLTRYI